MKTTAAKYETLIVIFAEPIRALDNLFDDHEAWGGASFKEWIDSYESSRFTQMDERTAVITSEYNMTLVREWLEQNTPIDRLVLA
ncbi:MAG: hypothetical protein NC209_00450 [Alistipes sp.]|nr:hypothetical protein [Lachnospiraceae bacterium]MCM1249602.1 hypothetical protein [Alistipes sp.]